MNRSFLGLLVCSIIVSLLSISLTLLKARLSDVTEISIDNMLNLRWLWSYKWYLAGVILIAIPWIISTLMTAQLAKELSQGTQTASLAALTAALVGAFLGFLQFFVYQILRSEALPPLGLNRVWINIGLMACLSFGSAYMAFDTIQRLQLLQT
jgi:hypothetical protein